MDTHPLQNHKGIAVATPCILYGLGDPYINVLLTIIYFVI